MASNASSSSQTTHTHFHIFSLPSSTSDPMSSSTAAATSKFVYPLISHPPHLRGRRGLIVAVRRPHLRLSPLRCQAAEVSVAENVPASGGGTRWVPVVPLGALPKGERRVIIQDGDEILLLWYKDQVFAIENRSPAEGAYTEGLINAKLTQDGCIVCPSTDSTFDLGTGQVKEWYPKNPVLRVLTPVLRTLYVYPAKIDEQNIYISIAAAESTDASAEIVFSGRAQPGMTASDVNVEEVRMVVDEAEGGFGFTRRNELINGKAAAIEFLLLLDFELLTGEGLLKGTGFLDFIYSISHALNN